MRFGTGEIILIVLVVLLLFGGKKIPELMKGLGKGVRSFKDGLNGTLDNENEDKKTKSEEWLGWKLKIKRLQVVNFNF